MVKLTWFERFQQGADNGAARQQLNEAAAPLAAKVPGLERYARSDAIGPMPSESGASEEKVFFDSYSCCWFASHAGFEQATNSPEWRGLIDGNAAVCDIEWQRGMSAFVEERTIKEGESSPYKAVWVLRFRPDIDRDWARQFWTNDHAKFVVDAPGVDRYLQNHVVGPASIGGAAATSDDTVGFDGFAECWFKDRAAYDSAVTSTAWEGLVAEGAMLFDMTFLWGAILEETVVRG